ncbi:hypothetical protein OS393_004629 [Klebsiella aerogenes]|nr:hypothetical protein [Klebsiella aerogenes]HBQ7848245.1 hypothetical protein [Klebsiella aerogenes]HBV6387590.1 hypothetical protein [Klebsiella aerogenes]HDS6917689.1 hypothetical protein [Klebsiella aerogenes]
MLKKVVAILPGYDVQVLNIEDDLSMADFIGDKGAILRLPIEKIIINDHEYLFCRFSNEVSEEFVKEAVEKNIL